MKVPPILSHKHDDAPSASTPESLLPELRRKKGLNFYEHWILRHCSIGSWGSRNLKNTAARWLHLLGAGCWKSASAQA